jgi:hypothetical protein
MSSSAATDAPPSIRARQRVALGLQLSRIEVFEVKTLVLVLVAVAVLAFAAGSFLTPPPVTSSRSHPSVVTASYDSPSQADIDSFGNVDAYGNEVTTAVAEYSLDPAGSTYELHAPQVEIPRLGSPKS